MITAKLNLKKENQFRKLWIHKFNSYVTLNVCFCPNIKNANYQEWCFFFFYLPLGWSMDIFESLSRGQSPSINVNNSALFFICEDDQKPFGNFLILMVINVLKIIYVICQFDQLLLNCENYSLVQLSQPSKISNIAKKCKNWAK